LFLKRVSPVGAKIVLMEQVHGADIKVLSLDGITEKKPLVLKGVDGVFFRKYSAIVSVGIRVADCIPVFILSENKLIGAVHAGRRSIAGGIMELFLSTALDNGYSIESMEFLAGPHICGSCYEVSGAAAAEFAKGTSEEILNGRHLNLYKAMTIRLCRKGIKKESVNLLKSKEYCTFENDRYCSYRRKDKRRSMAFAVQV
jgi:copper oxidase (laccase) domain-containing protein